MIASFADSMRLSSIVLSDVFATSLICFLPPARFCTPWSEEPKTSVYHSLWNVFIRLFPQSKVLLTESDLEDEYSARHRQGKFPIGTMSSHLMKIIGRIFMPINFSAVRRSDIQSGGLVSGVHDDFFPHVLRRTHELPEQRTDVGNDNQE